MSVEAVGKPKDEARTLLRQWLQGVVIAHVAHQRAAARYARSHKVLGVPATTLSILVGTSVFGTLATSEERWPLLIAGGLSLLAAVLGGVQTFLDYGARAAAHRSAGAKYGTLRRRFESIVVREHVALEDDALDDLRAAWDALDAEAPVLPQPLYDAAARYVRERGPLSSESPPDRAPKSGEHRRDAA